MKKAWIENSVVRDIANGNPSELFHPDVAVFYDTEVPDGTQRGATWDGAAWINPEPVTPTPTPTQEPEPTPEPDSPVLVSPVEFMLLFTSPERVAIKAARLTDPIIDDFLDIIEDPRLTFVNLSLGSTLAALDYMIFKELIAAERKAEIVTGVML